MRKGELRCTAEERFGDGAALPVRLGVLLLAAGAVVAGAAGGTDAGAVEADAAVVVVVVEEGTEVAVVEVAVGMERGSAMEGAAVDLVSALVSSLVIGAADFALSAVDDTGGSGLDSLFRLGDDLVGAVGGGSAAGFACCAAASVAPREELRAEDRVCGEVVRALAGLLRPWGEEAVSLRAAAGGVRGNCREVLKGFFCPLVRKKQMVPC